MVKVIILVLVYGATNLIVFELDTLPTKINKHESNITTTSYETVNFKTGYGPCPFSIRQV